MQSEDFYLHFLLSTLLPWQCLNFLPIRRAIIRCGLTKPQLSRFFDRGWRLVPAPARALSEGEFVLARCSDDFVLPPIAGNRPLCSPTATIIARALRLTRHSRKCANHQPEQRLTK